MTWNSPDTMTQGLMSPPGTRPHSVCMWPGCHIFAVTEIRAGLWGGADRPEWIALCTRHRAHFGILTFGELERMTWQPRKRRLVGS